MNENEMNTDIRTREIKPRERGRDPLATTFYKDNWYSAEEAAEMERRFKVWQTAYIKEGKDKWAQTHQGKLCLAFYDAFHAYRKYLEENAFARRSPHGYDVDYDEHKLFEEGLRIVEDLQERARRKTAAEPGKSAESGTVSTHIPQWPPVRSAPGERQKTLPHA